MIDRSSFARFLTSGLFIAAWLVAVGTAEAAPVRGATNLVTEMTPNGHVDPGEGVTMLFCIENPDPTATIPLVGRLLETNGIISPSEPQAYGSLPSLGFACRTFSFRIDKFNCGTTINARLALNNGTQLDFPLLLGTRTFSETFDGVLPPALPAPWSSIKSTNGQWWQTQAVLPDSSPNRVFVPDLNVATDSTLNVRLDLPAGGST